MTGRVEVPRVMRAKARTTGVYRSTNRAPPRSGLGSRAPGRTKPRTTRRSAGKTSGQKMAIGSRAKILVSVLIIVARADMSCLRSKSRFGGSTGQGHEGIVEGCLIDPELVGDDVAGGQIGSDGGNEVGSTRDHQLFPIAIGGAHLLEGEEVERTERVGRPGPDDQFRPRHPL